MNNWILVFLLLVVVVLVVTLVLDFDCIGRSVYWNDRGLFIDSWDRPNPFTCNYPPIPENPN